MYPDVAEFLQASDHLRPIERRHKPDPRLGRGHQSGLARGAEFFGEAGTDVAYDFDAEMSGHFCARLPSAAILNVLTENCRHANLDAIRKRLAGPGSAGLEIIPSGYYLEYDFRMSRF